MAAPFADRFFAAWNESDGTVRRDQIADLISPDLSYADPHQPAPLSGAAAYLDFADIFRARLPGFRLEHTSTAQTHDDVLIGWALLRPDGSALSRGHFAVALGPDGRARRIVGFLA
jgi:hypothetical protein